MKSQNFEHGDFENHKLIPFFRAKKIAFFSCTKYINIRTAVCLQASFWREKK